MADMVADQQPGHADAHPDQPREIAQLGRLRGVVNVDHPANRKARMQVPRRERGIEMLAADIVEIDVDAVLADLAQRRHQLLHQRPVALIIDHRIGAERLHQRAFVGPAGAADHHHPARLGDLHHGRSDRACGRRHEHDIAGLGPGHAQQTEIGGHPRHPEQSEKLLWRYAQLGKLLDLRAGQNRLVAPSQKMLHHVTDRDALGLALDHFADRAALHRLAQRKRRNVRFHVVHPPAHIGIDRQPAIGNADVAILQSGGGHFDQRKIGCDGHAVRAGVQSPGAGHRGHPLMIFEGGVCRCRRIGNAESRHAAS